MNATLTKLLIVVVGLATLVTSRFVPAAQELLLVAGSGLLGWVLPAPGGSAKTSPALKDEP